MIKAKIRFFSELNDLLPEVKKYKLHNISLEVAASVKDVIESMGIPHTEVDLIIVNGKSIDFSYKIQDGDKIFVYPVFESFDISPLLKLRPNPLRNTCFILDCHLGKLTKYLRLFGFDSKYNSELDDLKIATISKEETRIVLTRDRGLLKRNMITHGYLIRSLIPKEQVVEVFARFDLYNITQPFTRCMKCNGELIPIEKEKIKNKLLDNTYSSFDQFYICDQCDQIYWKGSHYNKLIDLIQKFQNK